jgi:hypothetical protein
LKEVNLDKHVKGIIGEEVDKKFSTWSDVVRGIKKCNADVRQIGLKPIQVIINQGVTQEDDDKLEGINMKIAM